MKFNKKVDRTDLKNMVAEIAYDLGLNKKLVKEVLVITFKEIAITLNFKSEITKFIDYEKI